MIRLRMDRAEAHRAGRNRRCSGKDRLITMGAPIKLIKGTISDEHPLAFVRDRTRQFGTRSAWQAIGPDYHDQAMKESEMTSHDVQ